MGDDAKDRETLPGENKISRGIARQSQHQPQTVITRPDIVVTAIDGLRCGGEPELGHISEGNELAKRIKPHKDHLILNYAY